MNVLTVSEVFDVKTHPRFDPRPYLKTWPELVGEAYSFNVYLNGVLWYWPYLCSFKTVEEASFWRQQILHFGDRILQGLCFLVTEEMHPSKVFRKYDEAMQYTLRRANASRVCSSQEAEFVTYFQTNIYGEMYQTHLLQGTYLRLTVTTNQLL